LNRGNYPSYNDILESKLADFVNDKLSRHFLLPIPIEKATELPEAKAYLIYIIV